MKIETTRLLRLALLTALLAGCVLDADRATPSAPPVTPTARPVTVRVNLAGRLLFVQDGNLYLHSGTRTEQITRDGMTRDPAWAPDGTHLAFVRRETSYSDLYLLNAAGGLPTQVTFNRGRAEPWTQRFMHEVVWALQPDWSPDGRELVFVSQVRPPTGPDDQPPLYEFPLSLYRYPLRLIGQRQPTNDDLLLQAAEADLQQPAWSPDGAWIAFVRVPRGEGRSEIQLLDPATGEIQPYAGIPAGAYDPAWSPDGRWLAFAAALDGHTDVWAIPAPGLGSTPVRLTQLGQARAPAWSPDGTQLAVVHIGANGSDLYVVPLERTNGTLRAGEAVALTSNGHIDASSGLAWGR